MTNSRGISELAEFLWKIIREKVQLNCKGCDTSSTEYAHSCQKLFMEYYLIDRGFLAKFYHMYFDKTFDDVADNFLVGTLTRYKKARLKEEILSYLTARVQTKSLFL